MTKFQLSNQAIQDLDKIWFYTYENWSIQQADIRFKQILNQIEFLSKNQNAGKSYDKIKVGLKGSLINPHIIFYQLRSDGIIEILRILHQKMDFDGRL